MRLLLSSLLCALCLGAMLPLWAAPPAPLTLTATADRTVLMATAQQYRRDFANHSIFELEPARVTLTFTNTGTTPVKLDVFRLRDMRLQLEIRGPDSRSIEQKYEPQANFGTLPIGEKDYPILQPGESWKTQTPLDFPGGVWSSTRYLLEQTGAYHVRFLYVAAPSKEELATRVPLQQGAFQGAVASNELLFKLIQASDPLKGLRLAMDAQPAADPLSGALTLTAYLSNVSDKTIYVNAWNLCGNGLILYDAKGAEIHFNGGADASREATPDERYATLQPGQLRAFPLNGAYYPTLDTLNEQVGSVSVTDNTGFFRDWPVRGRSVVATAVLDIPETPVMKKNDAPGPLWAGKLSAPPTTIPLNPTAYRQAKLKQDLSRFVLQWYYTGEQDKPFYALRLHVAPEKEGAVDAFSPSVQISATEAAALIDYLAKSGVLRDAAKIVPMAAAPVPPSGYSMHISGDDIADWQLFLGWDLAMYQRLAALQAQCPAGAQDAMSSLLARLTGLRAIWEAEDALGKRITLDLPEGTLADGANAVKAASNCPALKVNVDHQLSATPLPALHFDHLTVAEVFQYLANAANVRYAINEDTVRFQSAPLAR